MAQEDIPDAKERLQYIVSKTDEAAHRTMNVAEETMDLQYKFMDRSNDIVGRWQQFRGSKLSKEEFVKLNEDLDEFLGSIAGHSSQVNDRMSDIMLAQDYQDITGQMIKQVVKMVQEVEEKLVSLVALSGSSMKPEAIDKNSGEIAEGPQLPNADNKQIANNQEDVDDLLASLGF